MNDAGTQFTPSGEWVIEAVNLTKIYQKILPERSDK